MISRVTPSGKVLFLGITNRVLSNMTPAELQLEAERVEQNLARHTRVSRELGHKYVQIDAVKSEKRCLVSERERIERELKRRREAQIEQSLDEQEYAETVEA